MEGHEENWKGFWKSYNTNRKFSFVNIDQKCEKSSRRTLSLHPEIQTKENPKPHQSSTHKGNYPTIQMTERIRRYLTYSLWFARACPNGLPTLQTVEPLYRDCNYIGGGETRSLHKL